MIILVELCYTDILYEFPGVDTAGTMGELMLVSVEVLHFLPMLNLSLCQTMVNANVGLVYWLVHGI